MILPSPIAPPALSSYRFDGFHLYTTLVFTLIAHACICFVLFVDPPTHKNPNPQCESIRRWGLPEVTRAGGWSPHE